MVKKVRVFFGYAILMFAVVVPIVGTILLSVGTHVAEIQPLDPESHVVLFK